MAQAEVASTLREGIEMKKRALITGICGQDGTYLTKLLLEKGYDVRGLDTATWALNKSCPNFRAVGILDEIEIYDADVSDLDELEHIVRVDFWPDEIYNLAATTSVSASFDRPHAALDANAAGALNVLEVARSMHTSVKVVQASSSDMFGGCSLASTTRTNESSALNPRSPYAASKAFAHHMVQIYRARYGLFACSAILFPHESKIRNAAAVSQKIARGAVGVVHGELGQLELGNLMIGRDWGHAEDSVRGMYMALQRQVPDDYVFATGVNRTILAFTQKAFELLGMKITWHQDNGQIVRGADPTGRTVVISQHDLYRRNDVDTLIGDSFHAANKLGWSPKKVFDDVVEEMVQAALDERVKDSSRSAAARHTAS